MLQNTFCHIPGVGLRTERRLWEAGILSWEDVLHGRLEGLPKRRTEILRHYASESLVALDNDDVGYFFDRLPASQHWRLFREFRHATAYLDIETTGLGSPDDMITVIGVYDGKDLRHYVQGENLDEFAADAEQFKLLVTYNGKRFDLPFIRNYLGLDMPQPHIDLMFLLRALGYRGGLKGCERQLGLERGELEGVDGYFAVLLWHEYQHRGDSRALDTLLAYNSVDVINLEALAVLAYNMRLQQTPFAETHALSVPGRVEVPYEADAALIRRIRRQSAWF